MAPFEAMNYDKITAYESFLMSNMVPQVAGLNRGGWGRLESYTREWAIMRNEIYVHSGVIFNNKNPSRWIGQNNVAVAD